MELQVEEWYKEVGELQAQAAGQDAVGKRQSTVGTRIGRLIEPLKEHHRLYQLSHEVDELEHWIAEKEVVAGSPELGQDLKHVTLLQEKFLEFASETGSMGWWWTSSSTTAPLTPPPSPSGKMASTRPGPTSWS
ncbi:spectrin beta chain-like [Geothlypis trichas]